MLDNGLLKYYDFCAEKEGRLMAHKVPSLSIGHEVAYRLFECKRGGKSFYLKECSKSRAEAEILISQLYPKLGVPSAIYLPAMKPREIVVPKFEAVISNSVKVDNVSLATTFKTGLDALAEGKAEKVAKYFTKDCVKQISTMQALDLAAGNCDRHDSNFFVQTDESGKAESIVTIDHESSGGGVYSFKGYPYYNYLNNVVAPSWKDIIFDLKENEAAAAAVSSKELAETIGSAPIVDTVRDIKEATGYEIGEKYVDALQRSFEEVAEDLVN